MRLPKQSTMPSLAQLQSMHKECLQAQSRNWQLPFGEPPEDYCLAAFTDRSAAIHWALYRGEGAASMLLWEQVSSDSMYIHRLITAQFPGLSSLLTDSDDNGTEAQLQPAPASTGEDARDRSGQPFVAVKGKPTLEGSLQEMPLANVLQSISMSQGTGRLEVASAGESAVVFIREGKPIHCTLPFCQGEAALIELVGWDDGEFRFYPENRQRNQTITKRLDTVLMEGAALDDKLKHLQKLGGKSISYPVTMDPAKSEDQLDAALLEADADTDLQLARSIYQKIDGRARLMDIIAAMELSKVDWVPVFVSLISSDLIAFESTATTSASSSLQEAKIDWSEARKLESCSLRADTGINSYPAFLLALEREHIRWTRFGRPYAVAILELSTRFDDPKRLPEPLFASSMKEVATRINETKRESDILGHFETFKFAMLLPETNHWSATRFADRLGQLIDGMPVGDQANGLRVNIKVGVACIPEDCSSLGALLALARPSRVGTG